LLKKESSDLKYIPFDSYQLFFNIYILTIKFYSFGYLAFLLFDL